MIEPTRVLVVDGRTEINLGGLPVAVARDEDGFLYLADAANGVLNVFGKDGAFVRQIGRKGAGPGEYQAVTSVMIGGQGDVYVLDGELSRLSVFARGGELKRTAAVVNVSPVPTAAVLLSSGDIVTNVSLLDPNSVGFALQQVNPRGERVRLFDEQPFDATQQWRSFRVLAKRSNGDLVVARRYEYVLDVYTDRLRRKTAYLRDVDWFPPWRGPGHPSDGTLNVRPTPLVSAMWEQEGLLWILLSVPAASWQPASAAGLPPFVNGKRNPALAARTRYESVVEAIDLSRGVVVASSRLQEEISGLALGGGHVARYRELPDGSPQLEIWRFSLTR